MPQDTLRPQSCGPCSVSFNTEMALAKEAVSLRLCELDEKRFFSLTIKRMENTK